MDNLLILFEAPILSVQLLIDGILVGAIFALAAYGMALVWGVMNVINVAQGEFVILGGFVSWFIATPMQIAFQWSWIDIEFFKPGIHPLLTAPFAAAALFGFGWAIYRVVIFRVVDKDLFISLLATFGISILLQQLMNEVFGADIRNTETGLGTRFLFEGMVTVAEIKVVAFVMAILLGTLLVLFLRVSRLGQAIRATAQNARAARIMGIDTDRVYATTFALNAAICGAAGALVAMTWVIHPYIGLTYTVRSFMIVILAGLGNLAGVIAVGLGLGAAENFAGFLLGAEFQAAFLFSLLVVVLVARSLLLSRQRKYLK
jgi:branched-chain amino acid transport system permease protein